MDSLVEMFCDVDDFCQEFQPHWEKQQLTAGVKRRRRAGQLCLSEIMTIIIHFHQSSYRDLKAYYQEHVAVHLRSEFPNLDQLSTLCDLDEGNHLAIMWLSVQIVWNM